MQLRSIGQSGAMGYIRNVMPGIDAADFFVIDDVLEQEALSRMTHVLLTSTFWFDVTNGAVFVAHFDDGLVHSAFYHYGQVSFYETFREIC